MTTTTGTEDSTTKILLLNQSKPPPYKRSLAPLPGTRRETRGILDRMGNTAQAVLLDDEDATVDRVTAEMKSNSWAHFACHGSQHPEEPLESGFYLRDRQLKLNEIIQERLPHAEFAFLSACETSVGHKKLPDEAVHLAAGMLAAGYQGVAATM